ncbi:MAG: hypothetical protein KAJ75_04790 [Alphaproteobacteria bacterium]|nr:hypothetical protein [Alphaproteobacteria bacterium]
MEKSLTKAFNGTLSKVKEVLDKVIDITAPDSIRFIGTEEEQLRLTKIVNRTAQSKLGRETLEIAAKAGYSVKFSTSDKGGSANSIRKEININPTLNDAMLVMVLVHEAQHAKQFSRKSLLKDVKKNSIKTMIMFDRASEADAQRTSCITGWELKQKGDEFPYKNFADDSPLITRSFEKAVKKGGNADMAAFKGWYDDGERKSAYEKSYIVNHLVSFQVKCKDDKLKFNKNCTGKEVTDKMCLTTEGENYFTDDAGILEKGKFLDVKQETMTFLKKFMMTREIVHGLESDKSLDEISIRSEKNNLNYKQQKQTPLNSSKTKASTAIAKEIINKTKRTGY